MGAAILLLAFAGICGAWAKTPLLLSYEYTDSDVYKIVMGKFPVGTAKEKIIKEFPLEFISFDAKFDDINGIRLKKGEKLTGQSSIIVVIYKNWPKGFIPFIQYRFLHLAFDESLRLIGATINSEIDAP